MTIYPKYYLGFNIGLHPQTHNTNLKVFYDEDGKPKNSAAAYSGNVIKLNPRYFGENGLYKDATAEQIMHILNHEVGHDFGLDHVDENGNPSNNLEDYPDDGIMAGDDGQLHYPTTEETNKIVNSTPLQGTPTNK